MVCELANIICKLWEAEEKPSFSWAQNISLPRVLQFPAMCHRRSLPKIFVLKSELLSCSCWQKRPLQISPAKGKWKFPIFAKQFSSSCVLPAVSASQAIPCTGRVGCAEIYLGKRRLLCWDWGYWHGALWLWQAGRRSSVGDIWAREGEMWQRWGCGARICRELEFMDGVPDHVGILRSVTSHAPEWVPSTLPAPTSAHVTHAIASYPDASLWLWLHCCPSSHPANFPCHLLLQLSSTVSSPLVLPNVMCMLLGSWQGGAVESHPSVPTSLTFIIC